MRSTRPPSPLRSSKDGERGKGRLGGPPLSVLGTERYRQMAVQLHRHRRGIFEDPALRPRKKAELVTALDALLALLLPLTAEVDRMASTE